MIKRCNDFGAGGVCVAIGELADGLDISLDLVPKKYDGLDGTELAISESQERMAVVLDEKDAEAFAKLAYDENLETTIVAKVKEDPRLTMTWRGDKIVDLSREFLNTNGVTQHAKALIAAAEAKDDYRTAVPAAVKGKKGIDALKANLSRLEVCSQKGLVERFDSSIGAATVLMPYAGKYQLTPENAMCAKVPVPDGKTDTATAMSFGFIPGISRFSPFHGSVYAVTESLVKLAVIGADPHKSRLTMQEYFERLYDKPERWGKPAAALLGGLTAQLHYETPAIGGKDSMSGSFNDMDVPPTLVCFAISATKASKTVSAAFKKSGSKVALLRFPVFGNAQGFKFSDSLSETDLFAPIVGSVVAEIADESILSEFDSVILGVTDDSETITLGGESAKTLDLAEVWGAKLENVFPTKVTKLPEMKHEVALYTERSNKAPAIKVAKPKVVIPVFPGTNCEFDSARAFEKAGAETEIIVLNNLTSQGIDESVERFVKAIKTSQIIMLPGGFSGGDEPDGSGKFIATTLRNAKVKDAVTDLLENRDGLMLGICNGFQALIKTGLVPYGKIVDTQENDPTLTFNTIGRHVSTMVYTRIASVKSPWLSKVNAGDVFAVPVSHGEGRFVADDETLARLIANGQVATQYVDLDGKPAADIPFNPNGSVCAIEGITSPDGRVFGKMGHTERKGDNLYFNVPGCKDPQIFEAGVEYFK